MIEINLLPWRAIIRAENEKRKKNFFIYLAILVLIWLMNYLGFKLLGQSYDATLMRLQSQLTELSSQTQQSPPDYASLMIKQIHLNQLELLDFFTILTSRQSNIVLSTIRNKNNYIMLKGDADSFVLLAHFVKAYNLKNKISPMTILSAKKSVNANSLQFNLRLPRSMPSFLGQIKNDDV